jgi:dephospho-CoA kinase
MRNIPEDAVLVHDLPLLVEVGLQDAYDMVLVVDAPDEVRVQRLLERGLDEQDARARIAAQATREQRLAVADVVLDNSGSLGDLREQVERVWTTITGVG